jgi:hypothetical protein
MVVLSSAGLFWGDNLQSIALISKDEFDGLDNRHLTFQYKPAVERGGRMGEKLHPPPPLLIPVQ